MSLWLVAILSWIAGWMCAESRIRRVMPRTVARNVARRRPQRLDWITRLPRPSQRALPLVFSADLTHGSSARAAPARRAVERRRWVLATAHLDTVQAAGGGPTRGDVSALAAHVRELAVRAVNVEDTDERAQLYGELLSTCAGCHQIVRPNPVK
jgi:hypothetical protein